MTTKAPQSVCSISLIAIIIFFAGTFRSQAAEWDMGPGNAMASAQGERPDMKRDMANMKWWYNDKLAASMQLTTLQKDALETDANKRRLAMIDLRADVQKTRLILETSLDSKFSKDTSLKYLTDYLAAKNRFEEARMKGLINTREILTEEQFRILKNHTSTMNRQRREKRREPGMRNRPDQRRM